MALLIALGAMGTAYGAWIDEVYIEGTISTGDINAALACGDCWEEVVEGVPIDVPDTDIDCTGGSMTLTIDVTSALEDVDYYCSFIVSNTAGSLPIKIKTVTLTPSGTYTGVTAVFDDLTGTVLDPGPGPGSTATGQVHIYVTSQTDPPQNPAYTLAVTVKRWNE